MNKDKAMITFTVMNVCTWSPSDCMIRIVCLWFGINAWLCGFVPVGDVSLCHHVIRHIPEVSSSFDIEIWMDEQLRDVASNGEIRAVCRFYLFCRCG